MAEPCRTPVVQQVEVHAAEPAVPGWNNRLPVAILEELRAQLAEKKVERLVIAHAQLRALRERVAAAG